MTDETRTAAALVEAGLSAESAEGAAAALAEAKMHRALNGVEDNDNPWYDADVAWDRAETDPCERGTVGCSRRHTDDSECATW